MPSPQLVLAAQTNGKLSRGPVTPEGKRKSSANSRKHGLRSKTLPTDQACEAHRQWLLPHLIAQHNPTSPIEFMLVETIALAAARQDWASRMFDQTFADAMRRQIDPEGPHKHRSRNVMELYHRALCRFHREERRALQQLRQLQSRPRPAAPSQPLPEKPKMNERTLSAAAAQAAPPPPAPATTTNTKMNERTDSPRSTPQQTAPQPSPRQHRPPLILPHRLEFINRAPFAPSPACGNPKRT